MQRYEKYKDSGIEWIGEIPEHWDVIKLKYIGKSIMGIIYSPSDVVANPEQGILVFRASNIQNGKLAFEDNVYVDKEIEDNLKTKFGDILICSRSGSASLIGKNILIDEQSVGNTFGAFMTIFRTKIFSFLYFFFNSQVFKGQTAIFKTVTINQLTINVLNNFIAAIPPAEEQTAIANYLDRKTAEIDNLIAKKEKLLELYEEEKTAVINLAVTRGIEMNNEKLKMKDSGVEWLGKIPAHWEVKKLKYYFDLITEKNETDGKKIGLENIESKTGKFIETDSEFEGEGISFLIGDILFGKLRPYLAKVYIAKFKGKAVGDFFVFRSKGEVIPEFGSIRLLDYSFIDITNSSTYGAKMPRVNWEFIANLEIAFPSQQEQTAIVAHIEKESARIDAKAAKTQKLIELLKEYCTALISEAVTGKIKIMKNEE